MQGINWIDLPFS